LVDRAVDFLKSLGHVYFSFNVVVWAR
jgi:hypothetical protein